MTPFGRRSDEPLAGLLEGVDEASRTSRMLSVKVLTPV
jgi:hypothetical protein